MADRKSHSLHHILLPGKGEQMERRPQAPEEMKVAGEKILIIDDEPEMGRIFSNILSEDGYKVLTAASGEEGIRKVFKEIPDLIFLDMRLPDRSGIDILRELKEFNKEVMVIVLTGYGTVKTAVRAIKLGAYDYLAKPLSSDRLKIVVKNALNTYNLTQQVATLKASLLTKSSIEEIVANSPQMQEVFNLVRRVATHDVTVLILGESGTGKELVARAIQNLSHRKRMPFIPIDCASLPETLVESELFGFMKGAFTGAVLRREGKFELAHGGTVFLDEIGNLNPHIQVKLLRILQEREFVPLGGKMAVKVDVRVIAATNIDLNKASKEGQFRDDLYHRLNQFAIFLPPLRERQGDIPLLCDHFLKRANQEMGKHVTKISPEAKMLLSRYSWPGNVRELENTVKTAVLLADEIVLKEHLPFQIHNFHEMGDDPGLSEETMKNVSKSAASRVEREIITRTLKKTRWNKSAAARILEVDNKTLYNKIKKYNISYDQ